MHLILYILSGKTPQWPYVVWPLHSLYNRRAQPVLDFYTSPTSAGVMLNLSGQDFHFSKQLHI